MTNVLIIAFAVAFILALLEEPIFTISIFVPIQLVNAVVTTSLSYWGLYLMEPLSIKMMIIHTLAASFLARTALSVSEKAATYRITYTRQAE